MTEHQIIEALNGDTQRYLDRKTTVQRWMREKLTTNPNLQTADLVAATLEAWDFYIATPEHLTPISPPLEAWAREIILTPQPPTTRPSTP